MIYRRIMYRRRGHAPGPASLDAFIVAGKKVMARHKTGSQLLRPSTSRASTGTPGCRSSTTTAERSRLPRTVDGSAPQLAQALAGLTKLKSTVLALSGRTRPGDEANPQQASSSRRATSARHRERLGVAVRARPEDRRPALAPVLARSRCRATTQGQVHADVPRRLGSRDPESTSNRALAIDWIRAFTATSSMRQPTSAAA